MNDSERLAIPGLLAIRRVLPVSYLPQPRDDAPPLLVANRHGCDSTSYVYQYGTSATLRTKYKWLTFCVRVRRDPAVVDTAYRTG